MKIKQLLEQYTDVLKSLLLVGITVGLCFLIATAIVFPLWSFAEYYPHWYTIACLVVFACLIAFFVSRKLFKAFKTNPTKTLLSIFRIVLTLVGLGLAIIFVLASRRLIALAILIVTFLVYGLIISLQNTKLKKEWLNRTVRVVLNT